MKHVNNERGAAFLLALLVTALVTGFAVMLMSQTMTARTQSDTVASRAEARLAAEAGIDIFSERLSRSGGTVPSAFTHDLDGNQRIEITAIESEQDGDELIITFTSTGFSGERSQDIQAVLRVTP